MNLILETNPTFFEQYGLLIALAVVLVVMMVYSYIRNKKFRESAESLISGLKKGDTIKTYSGIYGEVVSFSERNGLKTVVLKTGANKNMGYLEIDVNAIYSNETKPVESEEVKAEEEPKESNEEPKENTKESK